MKYLLLFFIFMLVAFQWRQSRKPKVHQAAKKKGAGATTTDMVACAHCGVHVPQAEAVQGSDARYCSAAHRQVREP